MADRNEQSQQVFKEQVRRIQELFLRGALEKKLQEKGIQDDALIDALTNHILSEAGEVFDWDDGDNTITRNVDIEFSEQDSEELVDNVRSFLRVDMPKIVQSTVKDSARSLVKELENNGRK